MAERMTAVVDLSGEFCEDGMKPGRTVVTVPRNPDPSRERYSGNPANPFVEKTPHEQAQHKKKKKDEQGSALWDAQYADVVAATLSVSLGHDPTPSELAAAKTYWLNHR